MYYLNPAPKKLSTKELIKEIKNAAQEAGKLYNLSKKEKKKLVKMAKEWYNIKAG
jgi:hypothetical protein